ncbi:tRNA (guanine(46)-N(7))-methyltransferase TrmB [Beijerinckia indica]|uniref:tRNA (guanine-N(7)-)-methyltransferase n=1 Tax=Beijerinckia indica subsp. indica (strain ATCC 9039 / DSM 1715 / NCIMB 8712) TaxID=395963 RepID=B2IIL3_BEII9|nr:tRNA (guanosine(46)-N(7))-methyltransferase TrmB [Beijerinckia indica]ACB94706.1 tRNA (guanine-N(7)-)-methyltransferase [Beijerinckia indica subsp. indica ATCC 9039]
MQQPALDEKDVLPPAPEAEGAPCETTLYGRRRGKKLRSYHSALMREKLPEVALDLSQPVASVTDLFPHAPEDVWLEIGFGGGEHLAGTAASQAKKGFIGCEAFHNGVAKILVLIEAEGLRNIRVFEGDARKVLDALPQASLAGIFLLYPDPWPKRRQRKRRFLSDAMLERLARVLRPGAPLRFATDIDDYAGWTLARVLRSPDFDWPAQEAVDWHKPWEGWTGTRYEAKALRLGHHPAYYTFIRK